jgi:hypothetical protein
MEEYQKNLLIEVEAGSPARKVVRPIPEEQSTEIAAANTDKGSKENYDANKEKETPVENEGAALIQASKNTPSPRGKKAPRSKKASLSN